MKPDFKLSVLISARKDSKYLAKFLAAALEKTYLKDTEFLICINAADTWNKEIINMAQLAGLNIMAVFAEDWGLGRGGLHEYFNELYTKATGDWIVYFCDDHYIAAPGWDATIRNMVIREWKLDSAEPWIVVPKFDNTGAMNHVLSKGFCEALGGKLGNHGWIDSYINELSQEIGIDRYMRIDDEIFHDFTHDQPNQLDDSRTKVTLSKEGESLSGYNSGAYKEALRSDGERINKFLGRV